MLRVLLLNLFFIISVFDEFGVDGSMVRVFGVDGSMDRVEAGIPGALDAALVVKNLVDLSDYTL